MLVGLLLIIIMSNATATNKYKSLLYSRSTILGLLLTAYITYNNLYIKSLESGIGIYNGLFNVNILTQSLNIFILILSSIILILTGFYPRKINNLVSNLENKVNNLKLWELIYNKNSSQFMIIEYALIIVFILCGATFIMSSGDLVSLFLSIELQSYGLYILATIYRNSESATSSGLTYFLLGGLSSCFILLGSAILYVNSGTTNLDDIYIINSINGFIFNYTVSGDNNYSIFQGAIFLPLNFVDFSLIILSVGLLFKISAAPFHFWSPDVYDGIPTIVTTFVAIIAKISIFTIMLDLVSYTDTEILYNTLKDDNALHLQYGWKNLIVFSSLLSLIIGSLLGLTQHRIKRLFAYSTISHVGFILLALCINNVESVQGYIFYIIQYSLSNLNAFFILIVIGYTLYNYVYTSFYTNAENKEELHEKEYKLIDAENSPVQLLTQLKGYFYINPFLSMSFAITLFSFVGIPPLIGFFAKQMVLSAALDEGYVFMTLIGVITSVIGAVYYLNIIKLLFFSKSDYKESNINITTLISSEGLRSNNIKNNVVIINDGLVVVVSILTMLISLFIFIPNEWFSIVSILSLSLCKT